MPFLVQGLLLCYWSCILGVLFSVPEPSGRAFNVGAVTPPLSPNAVSKCFPQEWHGGRGHGSTAQPGVPLEPGGLSQGEEEALGAQWGGLQQKELPRSAVEQGRGTSVLPCFTWSSGLGLPSCPRGSHCSHLVSLPHGPRSPPAGASLSLSLHAASGKAAGPGAGGGFLAQLLW